jgi:hypothetical protein
MPGATLPFRKNPAPGRALVAGMVDMGLEVIAG